MSVDASYTTTRTGAPSQPRQFVLVSALRVEC